MDLRLVVSMTSSPPALAWVIDYHRNYTLSLALATCSKMAAAVFSFRLMVGVRFSSRQCLQFRRIVFSRIRFYRTGLAKPPSNLQLSWDIFFPEWKDPNRCRQRRPQELVPRALQILDLVRNRRQGQHRGRLSSGPSCILTSRKMLEAWRTSCHSGQRRSIWFVVERDHR